MDQALLATAVVFASGFIGYLIRDIVSRHRRATAKRAHRIFFEGPCATDNTYVEKLSVRVKSANPTKTASFNILSGVPATSNPIMSFQRGAAIPVPSAPPMV